jgi:hypothetical protein
VAWGSYKMGHVMGKNEISPPVANMSIRH